jgi:signal transduction histidine kinase
MMVKRINRLITASIFGLIALSVIQGYLIRNTYILEKESFLNKANKTISRIDDYTPAVDSINEIWQNLFIKTLDKYDAKFIKKEEALNRLRKVTDSLNASFIKEYNKELATKNLKFDLKFHKIIKNIVLLDSIKNDTIFKENKTTPYRLLGDKFTHKGEHQISNSLWNTDRSGTVKVNGEERKFSYGLNFETQDYININGWQRIILSNMSLLLIMSVMIFAFVIGLLYYSIKNLITQKKIADIKTDFVNNITHELKTPLATLSLATKILKKEPVIVASKNADATVNTIERQNKRLQNLIDQVLNNSLGYKEIQLKKERLILNDYLHTILDDFLISVNEKDVNVDINIKTNNATVLIDKFFFTTALFNILENAIKYSDESVKINFTATCTNVFKIVIQDNGIGILSENKKLIFDKFFREGNKEVHNVKGLGLGLYYTNQIIKAHKGRIEVLSVKDKGAVFTIEIPLI